MLYADGQLVGPYQDDRSFDSIADYIEDQAIPYARGGAISSSSTGPSPEVAQSVLGRPNPEGKVIEVDEIGLATMESSGPVLVDFFAPWCSQ